MTDEPDKRSGLLHLAGFLVSGTLAFVVDVAVTKLLSEIAGVPWGVSRMIAIGIAMVVAWLCHRRLTFAVTTPISAAEFIKYAGVGWSAAVLNYLVFLAFIWLLPSIEKAFAIGTASLIAMVYTYLGLRFGVFAKR